MKFRTIPVLFLLLAASATLALAAGSGGMWIDVPFVAQTKDGCGSASISMVMRYWEKKLGRTASSAADSEKIQKALFSATGGGIRASMMEQYFRDSGYRTFAFQGAWGDLEHHLQQGRPLIVSLKASGSHGPLHYVVVVGVDSQRGYIFVNDPAQRKMFRLSHEGFESEWNPAHNWVLLAVPRTPD